METGKDKQTLNPAELIVRSRPLHYLGDLQLQGALLTRPSAESYGDELPVYHDIVLSKN